MESVYLQGSERVNDAGREMRAAAEQIERAVFNFAEALQRHRTFMDEWLARFEVALEKVGE